MGEIYLERNDLATSMALTRQALFLSQEQGSYPELTYRWQWQIGRIFTHLGQFADAQQAYELAINTLNPIRGQFFNGYRKDIGTLFREQIKPVYYELAGVHLQQAQISKDTDERQHRLSQVQGIIEQMKSAELQDLFQDECIVALNNKKKNLDQVTEYTAVLYPIMLENELVTLVKFPEEIWQYRVGVTQEQFDQTVRTFRIHLQTASNKRFLSGAQQLYQWLIQPLEMELQAAQIDTLIIVPDGTAFLDSPEHPA